MNKPTKILENRANYVKQFVNEQIGQNVSKSTAIRRLSIGLFLSKRTIERDLKK